MHPLRKRAHRVRAADGAVWAVRRARARRGRLVAAAGYIGPAHAQARRDTTRWTPPSGRWDASPPPSGDGDDGRFLPTHDDCDARRDGSACSLSFPHNRPPVPVEIAGFHMEGAVPLLRQSRRASGGAADPAGRRLAGIDRTLSRLCAASSRFRRKLPGMPGTSSAGVFRAALWCRRARRRLG